jgi:hypothetical protein
MHYMVQGLDYHSVNCSDFSRCTYWTNQHPNFGITNSSNVASVNIFIYLIWYGTRILIFLSSACTEAVYLTSPKANNRCCAKLNRFLSLTCTTPWSMKWWAAQYILSSTVFNSMLQCLERISSWLKKHNGEHILYYLISCYINRIM